MKTEPFRGEALTLSAADGSPLGASRFPATAPLRGRILVAGATGVPQTFYANFSAYAARRGFETVTFDYRGIGRSKTAPLPGFQASFLDWARLDLAAVVDALAGDNTPLFVVAHSFGGHALGLIPNHHRIAGWDALECHPSAHRALEGIPAVEHPRHG